MINDMVLSLHILYKNHLKNQKLDGVVSTLRECLESSDLPRERGNRPIRACGTCFISHKVAAIRWLLDRYGAYIAHLTSLTEDTSSSRQREN